MFFFKKGLRLKREGAIGATLERIHKDTNEAFEKRNRFWREHRHIKISARSEKKGGFEVHEPRAGWEE